MTSHEFVEEFCDPRHHDLRRRNAVLKNQQLGGRISENGFGDGLVMQEGTDTQECRGQRVLKQKALEADVPRRIDCAIIGVGPLYSLLVFFKQLSMLFTEQLKVLVKAVGILGDEVAEIETRVISIVEDKEPIVMTLHPPQRIRGGISGSFVHGDACHVGFDGLFTVLINIKHIYESKVTNMISI